VKKKLALVLGMLIISTVLLYFSKELQNNIASKAFMKKVENSSLEKKTEENAKKEGADQQLTEGNEANNIPQTNEKPLDENNVNHGVNSVIASEKDNQNTKDQNNKGDKPSNIDNNPKLESNVVLPPPKPAESSIQPNFMIYDATENKNLVSTVKNYDGNKNLYEYMKEVLDESGLVATSYIKSDGYVAIIGGLSDYPNMKNKSGKNDWRSCGWIFYINGTKSTLGQKDYIPKKDDIITWRYWKNALEESNN
jgi:hypothetical protein